mmetsp:Transcript_43580/g.44269  ORF Transcript_43580/g.44269 Transcript_43580/m.44269 type:complete len:84 (-) Transcript_43580:1017-1268(-)
MTINIINSYPPPPQTHTNSRAAPYLLPISYCSNSNPATTAGTYNDNNDSEYKYEYEYRYNNKSSENNNKENEDGHHYNDEISL